MFCGLLQLLSAKRVENRFANYSFYAHFELWVPTKHLKVSALVCNHIPNMLVRIQLFNYTEQEMQSSTVVFLVRV